jgi:hypothetical protein
LCSLPEESGRFTREQCAGSAYNDRIEMKRSFF